MKSRTFSILIVDDNGHYVKRMQTLLYEIEIIDKIHTAGNYEEATSKLSTEEHDFVLLDINLPDGNGINLLKEIKDPVKKRNCEVIMISNQNSPYYEKECKRLGAKYFLDKTNDFDKVPALLASMYN
ncbi:MAG: response regulator [Chitinophagaceae bacterium]